MSDHIEQLRSLLNDKGISDDDILNGVSLTGDGFSKIAKRLGLTIKDVKGILAQLRSRLELDKNRMDEMMNFISEDNDDRYSYETDYLGNVTVRDRETDKDIFIRSSLASLFLKKLSKSNDPQLYMASLFNNSNDNVVEENNDNFYKGIDDPYDETRGAAGCIFFSKETNRFMFLYRSADVIEPYTWSGCGGAMDAHDGDNPLNTVKREISEEVGFRGNVEFKALNTSKHGSLTYHLYLAIVKQEFNPILNWENNGWVWSEYGDFPDPLHPGMARTLKDPRVLSIMRKISSPLDEGILESILRENDDELSFDDEISVKSGSVNFPWKIDGKHGFANAAYRKASDGLQLKIINVSDSTGKKIDGINSSELKSQAMEYIKGL